MKSLLEADPSLLTDREQRACVKLARIARMDTVRGGAKALVLANRLTKMGCKFPAQDVVNSVYAASSLGLGEYGAYYCPECGSPVFGKTATYNHCSHVGGEEGKMDGIY